MDRQIRIQAEDFDLTPEVRSLTGSDGAVGAVVSFVGTVRGTSQGSPLRSMSLEHYPGMTEAEITRIVGEAGTRWPLLGVRVVHRVGRLAAGDNIVLVAVASAHRHAAFDAASYIMDFLKTRAPFWKKEYFEDGSGGWVDAREADQAALARWQAPAQ